MTNPAASRLEQIQAQAAALPAQFELESRPPFCILTAMRYAREAGAVGEQVHAAAEAMRPVYEKTGSYQASQPDNYASACFKLAQKHRTERRELRALHNRKADWLGEAETAAAILYGLNDIAAGKAPSGSKALRSLGRDERWVHKVRNYSNDPNNRKALELHSEHHVLRRIEQSPLEVSGMHRGTIAGCLKNVAAHYVNAGKLTEQIRREVQRATQQLQAEQAAHSRRLELVEEGEHWHTVAKRMRATGQGPSAIATATGQKLNTVKQYLKRQNC
ncbi:hypothetical protein PQS90_05005 [Pseudomonas sp. BLCC-B13]|uniref:hypothetical protein n=1 Tax=Pseudomonas sp. BLCC-B13 TaxID=3025314 RepID=UPI00234ED726|nr:hypothetical protein [Pseudomonas sp. BLCC-B13]MDC7824505.1 hypothetical protein [Pseudomonas sp. BLCC-B13]